MFFLTARGPSSRNAIDPHFMSASRLIPWGLALALIVYALLVLPPRYSYTGDGLTKLIQTEALLQSGFGSQELLYPAKDLDPGYDFYPFPGVYQLRLGEANLGPFPVLFALISTPVLFLAGPAELQLRSYEELQLMWDKVRGAWWARDYSWVLRSGYAWKP